MDSLKDFSDFLSLPYLCAKLVGVDPTKGRETIRFKFSCIALAIGVINHFYLMVGEITYFCQQLGRFTSLLEATKNVAYIAYGINTNSKVFAVLIYLSLLKNVLHTTEALYPKTAKEKIAYRVNENFWPLSIFILVWIYFLADWANCAWAGVKSLYEFLKYGEISYETPFWVAHPFNYHSNLRYALVYLSELWGGHLCVCSNFGIDITMCCLSRQMSMHFKYIGQEIERYRPTGTEEDCVFLAKLIERHQLILKWVSQCALLLWELYFCFANRLCLDLNEIFGVSLVFNFLSWSGIICLSAFQVTVEGPGVEFIKFLMLLISVLGQLYIVCYFGDELIECSCGIGDSAYLHPWYRGNISYKKQLCILIQRSQKPATLTAKGFSTVSFLTFKEVTSMSYKVFALLRTFHGGD